MKNNDNRILINFVSVAFLLLACLLVFLSARMSVGVSVCVFGPMS